jgi:hypothetical protein
MGSMVPFSFVILPQDLLHYCRTVPSLSVKNATEILIEIVLNLQITLGSMDISAI